MKTVRISCQNQPQEQKSSTLRAFLAARKKDDLYAELWNRALRDMKQNRSAAAFLKLTAETVRYFFGGGVADRLLPNAGMTFTKYRADVPRLFHFTPVENLVSIRSNGLVPPRRSYVFLTDSVSHFLEDGAYLRWKTNTLAKNTEFCILVIDAQRLAQAVPIYTVNRAHELP